MADDDDLLFRPATELAGLIRRRQVSPVELVEAVLARIEATRPTLNAFITVTADAARAEARAAERAVRDGADGLGPLHGIPFSVKDLTYTAGVRPTMGSPIFERFVPDEDAVPVARLKRAGAILVGKTTTPEFGHKPLTNGPLFGHTRNPWDPGRTPGGSSGGAAGAVAAGMGPLALGTDGGGSVRIPAACCGIVGLKATLGRIPHVHAPDTFGNNSYIGPMTRTVADNRLMFDVIEGPDPRDAHAIGRFEDAPGLAPGDRLDGVRIGWLPRVGNPLVDPGTLALAEETVRLLEGMGATVEAVERDFAGLEETFLVLLQSSLSARLARHLPEFGERIDRTLRITIERGTRRTGDEVQQAAQIRTRLFRQAQRDFERFDFLASPTLSAPALPLGQDPFEPVVIDGREAGQIRGAWSPYTWPFNLTGHPAITIPCGWTAGGLPVGFQIVGPWHGERRILDLAARIEAARPWAERRPPVAGS